MSHSVDSASFAALDRGTITSVSAMIPTPWISEVAAYAKAHPQADIGLHLTLTSECKTYRWESVASSDQVRTLLDSDPPSPEFRKALADNRVILVTWRDLQSLQRRP